MRGWYSSPISSADWASLCIHLSGAHVLLRPGFPRSGPELRPQHLGIVVCEAFLRIRPHFGLWLKTFNVKPKVVRGSQAEYGGAMVGKMANVLWLEGSFVETLKGWQSGWFYITEPRDAEWVAPPSFGPDPQRGSRPGKRRACRGV